MARHLHCALILLCACGSPPSGNDAGLKSFIAFATRFQGFRSWQSTPGVAPGAPQPTSADGGVHLGALVTYINAPVPSGTVFPVGTIIVKEPTEGAITERQTFAMVKRGDGYNKAGAFEWEWFELKNLSDTEVAVKWRGFGPPSGEGYGGDPTLCNDCHALARDNDFVWTEGLKLRTP